MKRILSLIFAIVLSFGLIACGGGDEGKDDGLRYTELSNGTYSVSDYEGKDTVVVIPESKDGKPVTKISANAFAEMGITEITIPASIIEIGIDAFDSCSKITKVTYLGTIDNWAEIKFGSEKSNPITISKNLVIGGNKVTTIALTTATLVSDYAFSSYTPLTSVDIGDNVVTVGASAFDGCSMLSNLTLGDKVERFEYRSFGNCDSLTEVIFTNSVKTLCAESFRDCDNLQSIFIPASVEVIEKAAFNYDSSLVSAVFEITEGWYVSTSENAVTGTYIDPEVMEDAREVAELLSVKMYDDAHYWRRAE